MRYGIGSSDCFSANPESGAYVRLAKAAEDLGYNSIWIGEHIVRPDQFDIDSYPYARGFEANSSWPDPFVVLSAMSAVTKTIRVGTFVAVVPYRPPVQLAQTVATLDIISDSRFVFGVGVGWMQEEFEALGVPFKERGARADESLEIIKALWAGDAPKVESKYFTVPKGRLWFGPGRNANPKIHVGGEGDAAWRRTARIGSGLQIAYRSPEELKTTIKDLKRHCEVYGRDVSEIEIILAVDPAHLLAHRDEIEEHEKLGVKEISFVPKLYAPVDRAIDLFAELAHKLIR